MLLPQMYFDAAKCERGLVCLRHYHRAWDEKRRTYQQRPYHDWSSNCADSLRYFALSDARNRGKPAALKYPDYGFVGILLTAGNLLAAAGTGFVG